MSEFRFKQFTIRHDHSSMKVGTDAVLLGAWASAVDGSRILDIGTGCGIVALMMAQRFPHAQTLGIDIDESSIQEATDNTLSSPFASRLEMRVADIRTFVPPTTFDCIVCNPPYFTEDTLPPDARRSRARNTDALSFEELISAVCRCLAPNGTFHVVLPSWEIDRFCSICLIQSLHLTRRMDVQTTPRKAPKRTLLTFSTTTSSLQRDTLVLQDLNGSRTEAYQALAGDFYL